MDRPSEFFSGALIILNCQKYPPPPSPVLSTGIAFCERDVYQCVNTVHNFTITIGIITIQFVYDVLVFTYVPLASFYIAACFHGSPKRSTSTNPYLNTCSADNRKQHFFTCPFFLSDRPTLHTYARMYGRTNISPLWACHVETIDKCIIP